jgi:urease accessory protein UreH
LPSASTSGHESRAKAVAPQRWSIASAGPWGVEVVHQLLGDGVFGGDCHRLSIVAGRRSRLLVRAVTATAVRAGGASALVTHLRVRAGSTLVYLPGALIPHAGSEHTSVLRVGVDAGGALLAASVVTPGRVAMGEHGTFAQLRQQTVVRVDRALAFAEHTEMAPLLLRPASAGAFGGYGAFLTLLACGAHPAAQQSWWDRLREPANAVGGASPLRLGGVIFRGLCATFGEAAAILEAVAVAFRAEMGQLRAP